MGLKRPRAGRGEGPFAVLAACALVLATAPGALPESRTAEAAAPSGCIATPAEYKAVWDARQVRCVSPLLFATTHARGSTTLYPRASGTRGRPPTRIWKAI